MKKGLLVLCVVSLTMGPMGFALPDTAAAAGKMQTTCPVMGGSIDKTVYLDYQGKRLYFCCPACIPEFKKEPAKYLKKLEAEGVQLAPAGKK